MIKAPDLAIAMVSMGCLAGCQTAPRDPRGDLAEAGVPRCESPVTVDGKLEEACYREKTLVKRFVLAGVRQEEAAETRAWLFWDDERLLFAFDCEDSRVVARSPSAREKDVDLQDRVEIFLWSGRVSDAYYCLELSPGGAVHDYRAQFYRRFDDSWSPLGLRWAAALTARGYSVEGELTRAGMEDMGFRLRAGERWRLGLFRADFETGTPGSEPRWIAWVDYGGPPDFHVADSLGHAVLRE